jgi:hypothetical protein
MTLDPPITPLAAVDEALRRDGRAVLDAAGVTELAGARLDGLARWWNDLPPDRHLKDGGHYRRRRHSCFVADGADLRQVPHRAHWQPLEYNALHGGAERWFDPIDPAMVASPAFGGLLRGLARVASALRGARPWYVEVHPFRIDTEGGIGRPTPEGAHRDGVDLVAIALVDRRGVKGGETRVFEVDSPRGVRFTLSVPWTTLLLDDARVIHETTPIQPLPFATSEELGHRDTLVVTLRADGFQAPVR